MRTYSHFLLTAVFNPKRAKANTTALLAGSIAPDVPLVLLSLGYIIDRRFVRPHLPDKTRCSPTFNDLYFNNPYWIAAHNIMHAPLPILGMGAIGSLFRRQRWGRALLWFAVGCGLHSAIDIPTHADDGPAIFFPIDWHTRVQSPVSYWDAAHNGRLFTIFEHILDLLLLITLLVRRSRGRNL